MKHLQIFKEVTNCITFYWYPEMFNMQKSQSVVRCHHGVSYQTVDMIKEPPKASTIETWLETSQVPIRRLFNTSGMKYRELGLKDQVGEFTASKASQVLSTDGMLIKRPLILQEDQLVAIGFNEKIYEGELI
ncbi:Spx/MgsR family RNA polymerase-binding regulatory protein [Enterococcus faecium]|nr:Spx/MgsR family RNA polymerase-binding regulatory protein [Enterococcus faecium]